MLDLTSDEMRRNPYPAYEMVRRESPVFHVPVADAWMIFDYDGVKRVLTDHACTSAWARRSRGWKRESPCPICCRVRAASRWRRSSPGSRGGRSTSTGRPVCRFASRA